MGAQPAVVMSAPEYLEFERASETKHELVNGEVFAMSGATFAHVQIAHNLHVALDVCLKGSTCIPLGSDMRVKVSETGLYTYPDLSVVCGKPIFEDVEVDTLLNPIVIFEILSPSTERYDRGGKFAHYRRIESLKNYVLVSQSEALIECFTRQECGQWMLRTFEGLDSRLEVPIARISTLLSQVYEGVDVIPGLPSSAG